MWKYAFSTLTTTPASGWINLYFVLSPHNIFLCVNFESKMCAEHQFFSFDQTSFKRVNICSYYRAYCSLFCFSFPLNFFLLFPISTLHDLCQFLLEADEDYSSSSTTSRTVFFILSSYFLFLIEKNKNKEKTSNKQWHTYDINIHENVSSTRIEKQLLLTIKFQKEK